MTMKSAQINKYGGSDVIEINQNISEPTLSSGKVLVSIKAASVNPVDWKIREGAFQQMIQLQFPSTLGMDFSGIIKQVGEGISDSEFKPEMKYMDRRVLSTEDQEHLQKWLWQRQRVLQINQKD